MTPLISLPLIGSLEGENQCFAPVFAAVLAIGTGTGGTQGPFPKGRPGGRREGISTMAHLADIAAAFQAILVREI
jgi:hypothetical protein